MQTSKRIHGLKEAQSRFGRLVDEIASWFDVGDPSWSTDAPPARVMPPKWLDPARTDRGGLVLRRHGALSMTVLRDYSLPMSYLSQVGVQPLVFTGQLLEQAPERLCRTAQYVVGTQQPGAFHPGGTAWETSARVRTVHERVRQGMRAVGWSNELGAPIPQPDVAATALLFGPLLVKGLRRLGARITEAEADDVAHLARAMAHGQGVVPELQADTHAEAVTLFEAITALNCPPDADSRALMHALLHVPEQLAETPASRVRAKAIIEVHRSLTVSLLGDEAARSLGLTGRGRFAHVVRGLAAGPQHHPRLVPQHDRFIHWSLTQLESYLEARAARGPVEIEPQGRINRWLGPKLESWGWKPAWRS